MSRATAAPPSASSAPHGPTGRTSSARVGPWLAVVLAAGVISALTAPGQTAGLSVFTDPLILELGVSRTDLSVSYLVATLLGAAAQPLVGKGLDRWGVRSATLVIAGLFALVLVGLSLASDLLGLTAGYVGVRMLGQGALSLAATTAVARTVRHRRGLALGITGAMGSAGISLAPLGLERLVAAVGTGRAWQWEALVVAVVVGAAALLLPRDPERRGPVPSGPVDAADGRAGVLDDGEAVAGDGWTLGEAARTSMFWVIAASLATSGMLSTGLAFHQIALLGEQGLSPLQAAANFLPQTATGIVTTLLAGALVDRLPARVFIAFAMTTLAGALVLVPFVSPGWSAVTYGLVLGAAGGSLRGMEAASYVRYFGTRHIGSIRGAATSISLASTALGPVALAVGHDLTGTFTTPTLVLAAVPLVVAVVGLLAPTPTRRRDELDSTLT